MRHAIRIAAATFMVLASCALAGAGQIWTDGNGDGLPDGGTSIVIPPSSNVTVGVWIDAQSFSWTNFLAYVEWSGNCFSYVSASYVISGGSNFPIDNFSHPSGIGFGGSGYAQGGVDQIGNLTLHVNTPLSCCVTPIIDVYNPYYVFSQLGAGSAYMLFVTNPQTCYNGDCGPQGACCFPDGSCVTTCAPECDALGGTYIGAGTDCSQCPSVTVGCCFCDGSCQDLTEEECAAAGGISQGPGTSCATGFCDLPGPTVCCFPDGTCSQEISCFDCPDAGGVVTFGDCQQPGICPTLIGACCLPTLLCEERTQAECDAVNGTWFGPDSSCEPNPCDRTAVEHKSWGRIKGLYR
jgi:hypothetical protein